MTCHRQLQPKSSISDLVGNPLRTKLDGRCLLRPAPTFQVIPYMNQCRYSSLVWLVFKHLSKGQLSMTCQQPFHHVTSAFKPAARVHLCGWRIKIWFSHFLLSHGKFWLRYCLSRSHIYLRSCLCFSISVLESGKKLFWINLLMILGRLSTEIK